MSTLKRIPSFGLVILVTAAAACGRPDRDRDEGTVPGPQLPVPQGAPSGPSNPEPTPVPSGSGPCSISLGASNSGVTSAEVLLNGAELLGPSRFPEEGPLSVGAQAVPGMNVLEAKVNGKPGDVLHLTVSGQGLTYLDLTITRATGKPVWVEGQFEVPDCEGE